MDSQKALGIEEKVKALIEPEMLVLGLEIYEIEYKMEQLGWTLRVFIDKKNGKVCLNDCTLAGSRINRLLDESNIIESQYYLEVSSPGLDRQLKTQKDFNRFKGEEVSVVTKTLIN